MWSDVKCYHSDVKVKSYYCPVTNRIVHWSCSTKSQPELRWARHHDLVALLEAPVDMFFTMSWFDFGLSTWYLCLTVRIWIDMESTEYGYFWMLSGGTWWNLFTRVNSTLSASGGTSGSTDLWSGLQRKSLVSGWDLRAACFAPSHRTSRMCKKRFDLCEALGFAVRIYRRMK